MRRLRDVRLSKVNASLLLFGLALLAVAAVGPGVSVDGTQISPDASWGTRAVLVALGATAIIWAVLASRGPVRELWADRGFLGARPREPDQFIARPDLTERVIAALSGRPRAVALVGIGGVGKTTLAAAACGDRRVQRRFRDGIIWLEAAAGKESEQLLKDLAKCLGMSDAESSFATVRQGRDVLAAHLRDKRRLIAVDNVWDRGPLDALVGLAPACTTLFTTRQAELVETSSAAHIGVDELTQEQALGLLGRWTRRAPAELPTEARVLCTRVGNLALVCPN